MNTQIIEGARPTAAAEQLRTKLVDQLCEQGNLVRRSRRVSAGDGPEV